MINTQRFYAEIKRVLKHERACPHYDAKKAAKAAAQVFESYLQEVPLIAQSLAHYWFERYIELSPCLEKEPSEENLLWLENVLNLIDGDLPADQDFSVQDWQEILALVNAEAQTMPLDMLDAIMSILVERKIIQ